MTRAEKEHFSARLAAAFAPPDVALLAELKTDGSYFPPKAEISLSGLQGDYHRLFSNVSGEKISLVESTYKPWTADKSCPLGFCREKGLLLGDCALHIRDIFRALNLDIPPGFQGTPDHLVLELELLSYLYRFAPEEQVRQFIRDHLGWIPNLRDEIQKRDSGFYSRTAQRLFDFLNRESCSEKEGRHESQNLH
jgi:TorA maturation chaperone TorD